MAVPLIKFRCSIGCTHHTVHHKPNYICPFKIIVVILQPEKQQQMETRTHSTPKDNQMIVTIEDGAAASEIRKALLLIRGVASVKMVHNTPVITPALRTMISKARKESSDGETILCSSPEEMQRYFDSL